MTAGWVDVRILDQELNQCGYSGYTKFNIDDSYMFDCDNPGFASKNTEVVGAPVFEVRFVSGEGNRYTLILTVRNVPVSDSEEHEFEGEFDMRNRVVIDARYKIDMVMLLSQPS